MYSLLFIFMFGAHVLNPKLKQNLKYLVSHALNHCTSILMRNMSVYEHFRVSSVAREAIISPGRPTLL